MQKIACVIPARLASSRFPKKILALLHGKPLIQWVWEAALRVPFFDSVTLAIDAKETEEVVRRFGGNYWMTSPGCASGTLRLCEFVQKSGIQAEVFVNWQGDEPFLHEAMIQELLQTAPNDGADVWTLKKRIYDLSLAASPLIAKVVTDQNGCALYFSRSLIPFHRDLKPSYYEKHIGIYAYTPNALEQIASFPTCPLAEAEQLEQLAFLYHGLKIRVHETAYDGFGIDIPRQLEEAHLLSRIN